MAMIRTYGGYLLNRSQECNDNKRQEDIGNQNYRLQSTDIFLVAFLGNTYHEHSVVALCVIVSRT